LIDADSVDEDKQVFSTEEMTKQSDAHSSTTGA